VRALDAPAVNEAYVAMFRATRSLFSGDGARGLVRQDRNARTHLLLSELFWTIAWYHTCEPEDYARVTRRMLNILTDGIAAPGVGWPVAPLPPLVAETAAGDGSSELFLRAATELINEEGYLGASVEKISARLNVTKGAFYHHNETKDELVVACFERTFEVMRRAIRMAEATCSTGLEVLASVSAALVEYQLAGNAPLLRTSALTSAPEALQPELLAKFGRISDRFASLISDGIADGSLRPVDVNVAAQMITGMINAAVELHYWTPGVDAKNAASLYVRPFFEGLLSPSRA
jgi:AcrR family transcriptional regulator